MILFKEDIIKQRAYIDKTTKNTSFIRFAALLKALGVENHYFHLTIFDKSLIGIDVRAKDLTLEQKQRIATEAKINVWYYVREIYLVQQQGSDPSMFKINRANCAMIWLYYNHIDVIQVCPRQTGKTVAAVAIFSHIMYVMGYNIEISMLTINNTLRSQNVARMKDARDMLPDYMYAKVGEDTDNIQELSNKRLRNIFKTYCYSKSTTQADTMARGMTSPTQHHDEFAMAYNNHITYPVAMDCTSAAITSARKNDQPSSNILTTTAGLLDTEEGKFAYSKIQASLSFEEKFYDIKNREELVNLVDVGSAIMMVYTVYSYRQLGYSHEWFKERIRRKGGTRDEIDRDYFNMWKHGTSSGALKQEDIRKLKENTRKPIYTQIKDSFVLNWYLDELTVKSSEFKDVPLVLGMDSSDNVGKDYTTLVMIDARDLSVVMTCRCNESSLIKMTNMAIDLMIEYPKIVIIPEQNRAVNLIELMLDRFAAEGINPYTRIYNEVIQNNFQDKYRNVDSNDYKNITGTTKNFFGFKTNAVSRRMLYKSVFNQAIKLNITKIYDDAIIRELSGLVIKNNRIDHSAGCHDDMVIAYLLANYLLFFGRNLHYYGLEGRVILSDVGTQEDQADAAKRQHIRELKANARSIMRKLEDTASPIIRNVLGRRLAQVNRLLSIEGISKLSVENEVSVDKLNAELKEKNSFNMNHHIETAY